MIYTHLIDQILQNEGNKQLSCYPFILLRSKGADTHKVSSLQSV